MSIKPSGYRYWIDDGNWYRSCWLDRRVMMEPATPIPYVSRRRVEQPVRFPDDDDALLVAILEFVDVSVVRLAAQMNRRWRRAAGTRALWQRFVQLRWPDVWSGLAAPKTLDARALYRRLACPQPWRETTPEGVLVLFELVADKKTVFSATANLRELQTHSEEAGLGGTELRLRPRDPASYEKVAALVDRLSNWDEEIRAVLSLI